MAKVEVKELQNPPSKQEKSDKSEDNKKEELLFDDSYILDYKVGEDVYEGDYIASMPHSRQIRLEIRN